MFTGSWLHGPGHVKRRTPSQEEKDEILAQIIKKKGYANHPHKEEQKNGRNKD